MPRISTNQAVSGYCGAASRYLAHVGSKAITAGADSCDDPWMGRIILDLSAQPADLIVDCSIKHICRASGSDVQQLITRQNEARPFQERRKQLELCRRRRGFAPVFMHKVPRVRIQHPTRKAQFAATK